MLELYILLELSLQYPSLNVFSSAILFALLAINVDFQMIEI
jgi:hypothetical protein